MRKNLNRVHLEGYVYNISGTNGRDALTEKVAGEKSKNPGTKFINGNLDIALDDEGLNIVSVHFSYVTPTFGKSKKVNSTYSVLTNIINNPNKVWLSSDNGKDSAFKVRIDTALSTNDFITSDGTKASPVRCEGGFVTIVDSFTNNRNHFDMDTLITKFEYVEADEEKGIDEDYGKVSGYIFDFRNAIMPITFSVRKPDGIKYFENKVAENNNYLYTKVWGSLESFVKVYKKEEESSFGESYVTTRENKRREYVITGTAKVPYDFGDEEVMTEDDLKKGLQDREVLWAEIQKRRDEYEASKGSTSTASDAPTIATKAGSNFTF